MGFSSFSQIIFFFHQIVAKKIKLNFLFKFCISEFRFCINLGLSELSLNNPTHRFNFVCGASDQKNEYALNCAMRVGTLGGMIKATQL